MAMHRDYTIVTRGVARLVSLGEHLTVLLEYYNPMTVLLEYIDLLFKELDRHVPVQAHPWLLIAATTFASSTDKNVLR